MIDICANYPDSYRYEDEDDPRLDDLTTEKAVAWEAYLQGEDEPIGLDQWLEVWEEEHNERV